MKRWTWVLTVVCGLVMACQVAQAQVDQIWKKIESKAKSTNLSGATLSNDKIASGLKEALTKSTGTAVASTGRKDGYFKNEAIKILLPGPLQKLSGGMRMLGMGSQLDALDLAMNRAAEQAAPAAKPIFLDAIKKMTFTDARQILTGGDTAATDYFKRTCSEELTQAFMPIVHKSMENVGVVAQYDRLTQNSMAGTLLKNENFNLDHYVVGKALDGLFYMLGQEEKQIRTNPAAQTTALLRQVFGKK